MQYFMLFYLPLNNRKLIKNIVNNNIKCEVEKIEEERFLKYIVSFRTHNEFHEQCVERIYKDITTVINPEKLIVDARNTRRGGLDICPFRSTWQSESKFKKRLHASNEYILKSLKTKRLSFSSVLSD